MKLSFEQACVEFLKTERLNSEIPIESGTYNKFCPNCFYRNGHPLIWCRRCGTQMVVYSQQLIRPTWRNYILRSLKKDEALLRTREYISFQAFKKIGKINFDFIWYKDSKDCTTPKFQDVILAEINYIPHILEC